MSRRILKICIDKFKSLPRDENGAAMMITLAVVLFLYLLCSSSYAIGMTINEKIQLQNAADAAACEAAAGGHEAHILTVGLPPPGMGMLPPSPIYSPSDLSWMQDNTNRPVGKNGWYQDQNDNLLLPANLGRHLCTHLHQTTHWERKRL